MTVLTLVFVICSIILVKAGSTFFYMNFTLFQFIFLKFHSLFFFILSCSIQFDSIQFISIPKCGIAQLSLPLYVSSSTLTKWRQQNATLSSMPILYCHSSHDSNRLQCLNLCQYTCCVHCLSWVYTCTAHCLWLYRCVVGKSSNYELGRLDKTSPFIHPSMPHVKCRFSISLFVCVCD